MHMRKRGSKKLNKNKNITSKKKNVCERHHHKRSYSNGLISINIYLSHLKWNESLMKTVEPDVVAWSSTNQSTFINKGFQFLRSESKVLEWFSERRWDIPSTTNFCDNAFQFPARWTMICYHLLIFSCFFLVPKGNEFSLQLEPWVMGRQNQSFCFEIWQKHQLVL